MKDSIAMGWEERTVVVEKNRLLDKLRENREKHRLAYQASLQGYKKAAVEQLEQQIAKARRAIKNNADLLRKRIDQFDPEDPPSSQFVVLHQSSFTLEVPQDHTKSYDVAIEMAEWETGDEITLTQSQFQCFVLDDWDWKPKFEHLNKTYSSIR